MQRYTYPFSAIVGQDEMKLALLLNAISPAIGGVLIRGEKGTAKSTAVRALAAVLPQLAVVSDRPFSCPPDQPERMCTSCQERLAKGRAITGCTATDARGEFAHQRLGRSRGRHVVRVNTRYERGRDASIQAYWQRLIEAFSTLMKSICWTTTWSKYPARRRGDGSQYRGARRHLFQLPGTFHPGSAR